MAANKNLTVVEETVETANVEVTTPEEAVVETAEIEVATAEETEEKVTFMQKVVNVGKKHGKKIAVAVGAVALGVAAYALGKHSGESDDFDEFDYDFDSEIDVVGDADYSEIVADVTEE